MPVDLSLLRKLMARTTSDSDAEALACIRKANALMLTAGLHWDDFFDRLAASRPASTSPRVVTPGNPFGEDFETFLRGATEAVIDAISPRAGARLRKNLRRRGN